MPLYEYQCLSCDHVQEELFSTADKATVAVNCKKCGGGSKRILFSRTNVHFKGSGFYVNEYGKSAERINAESDIRDMHDKMTTKSGKSKSKPYAPPCTPKESWKKLEA